MDTREGNTPLHIAAGENNKDKVSQLLAQKQCDPNVQNKEGDTPLHIACRRKCFEVIRLLLLAKRCNTSIANRKGDTPLHIAVTNNQTAAISELLDHIQCDPNAQNKEGDTPLHIAVKCELNKAVVQLLTWREVNPNTRNRMNYIGAPWQPLALIQCDPNVQNKKGDTPLHIAVTNNQTAAISELLDHIQCDPNAQNRRGDTPLHIAVKCELNEAVVQLLIWREVTRNRMNYIGAPWQPLAFIQCDPNAQNRRGDTPLHIAVKGELNEAVVQLLLTRKVNPDTQNREDCTPLHIAAGMNYIDALRLALSHCDPNSRNMEGDTPLHIAVTNNQTAAISELLDHIQCDPNAQNKEGDTPLHIAVKCELNKAVVQLLTWREVNPNTRNRMNYIRAPWQPLALIQCDPNVQNKKGDTPLHIAVTNNQTAAISELLDHIQCDPNAQNRRGDTPLHIAVTNNQTAAISELLDHKQCDPNAQNKEGDTPLHIAVKCELNKAVVQLLTWREVNPITRNRMNNIGVPWQPLARIQCDPNAQNKKGDTPMHIACYSKFLEVIRLLLSMCKICSISVPNHKGETAQEIPLNKDGDCLIHLACQWGDRSIIENLIRCNTDCRYDTLLHINLQNKQGDTPLHIACHNKFSIGIKLLLKERCSINVPNNKGETAQEIPVNKDGDHLLHLASVWGDVGIVHYLITNQSCNPNIRNSCLNTPLHIAVEHKQYAVIAKLLSCKKCTPNLQNKQGDTPLHIACRNKFPSGIKLLLKERCSINVQNNKGETAQEIPVNEDGDHLLHLACQWGDVAIVQYLITNQRCNPTIRNSCLNTPLHIAVTNNQTAAISELLHHIQCDQNAQNEEGDTPLHIACAVGNLQLCKLIMASVHCDVNTLNMAHMTPLLVAIKQKRPSVATALLQHKKCDLNIRDSDGNTALHLACVCGETQSEMAKIARQLLKTVDPLPVNLAGQTPIELTTNYELVQAISHFTTCKTKHPVQTYINMFIVGEPKTGKTTLVEAINYEAHWIWKILPKFLRIIRKVPPCTAGIIPTTFQSKTFGSTVLHDLAGQTEYYTSHATVIQTAVTSTQAVFIIVVNVSESEEKISETLRYWWSFVNNHAARASAPPEVILAASHADKVKKCSGEKMYQMPVLLNDLTANFNFAGQVALDCRDIASTELRYLCSIVDKCCTKLRQSADADLHCHVLYAFLLKNFPGKIAITVSEVAAAIQETDALLPQNLEELIPLISTLSDKGLLFLVSDSENNGDGWVILQKKALLGEVNGSIFAPKDFSQHKKDLSSSTGVVPLFKLEREFPHHDPAMIAKFLTHLEFCFKVDDPETLKLLKDEVVHEEEYYFFPALVSVENPSQVWEQDKVMICQNGWFYRCIRKDQFLTPQFLHVLILRLAYSFALQLSPGDYREHSHAFRHEDSHALCRRCSVWKHGIGWLNRVPIETVVEVGLLNQSVIVMMRYPKGEEDECEQLRSKIIQKVLEAKDEHCRTVEMSESFIHPDYIKYPFFENIEDLKHYSLTEIAKATIKEAANVLDCKGRNPFPMKDLLLFDPCCSRGRELLSELFSTKHSLVEQVRGEVQEALRVTHGPAVTLESAEVGETRHKVISEYSHNTPTLHELVNFPGQEKTINIPQEIGTQYKTFGIILLKDDSGARVDNIVHVHRERAERINTEILQEWLNGRGEQPVTWKTLVQVLRDIGLSTLADDISTIKCPSEQ